MKASFNSFLLGLWCGHFVLASVQHVFGWGEEDFYLSVDSGTFGVACLPGEGVKSDGIAKSDRAEVLQPLVILLWTHSYSFTSFLH